MTETASVFVGEPEVRLARDEARGAFEDLLARALAQIGSAPEAYRAAGVWITISVKWERA